MNKTISVLALLASAGIASSSAFAANDPLNKSAVEAKQIELLRSYEDKELQRQHVEQALAPIQSRQDLDDYLRQASSHSPLNRLSPDARKRFLDSLVFNQNGLVGYRYDDLSAELSATEAYQILSLFGAQRTASLVKGIRVTTPLDREIMSLTEYGSTLRAPDDHVDYQCVSRANCYWASHYICMSGC